MIKIWGPMFAALNFLDQHTGAVSALTGIAIAVFTFLLARKTGSLADIAQMQHALDRSQFLAINRPHLRIRHVTINVHFGLTNFFNHGEETTGGLCVVNVGGTRATVVESRYRIFSVKPDCR